MLYEDFMKNWDELDIVHLSADSFSTGIMKTIEVKKKLFHYTKMSYISYFFINFSSRMRI